MIINQDTKASNISMKMKSTIGYIGRMTIPSSSVGYGRSTNDIDSDKVTMVNQKPTNIKKKVKVYKDR